MPGSQSWVRFVGCLSLLTCCAGQAPCQDGAAASPPKLADVRARYQAQKAQLQQLSVKWLLRYQLHVDPAVAARIDGHTDYLITEVHAAFSGRKRFYNQKYRLESGKHDTPGGLKRTSVAYDGQTTQWYKEWWDPRTARGSWVRLTSGDTTNQFNANDEYMACHGLPKAIFRILGEPEPVALDLAEFLRDDAYRLDPTPAPAEDGTPCLVARGGRDRVWFDPRLGFALRQREWQHREHPWPARRLRFGDHVECRPGLWLARTVYIDFFADPGKYAVGAGRPYKTGVLRVSELNAGLVPDSLFRPELPSGVWVEDATRFERQADGTLPIVNYNVPAQPADLERVAQQATESRRLEEASAAQRARITRLILVGNVALLCAAGVYLLYKRYRRRPAAGVDRRVATASHRV